MCSSSAVSGEGSRDELRYWKQTCCCFAMVRSPSFGGVVKQVRLGLCTDGMGPPRAESVLEPVVSQLRIPTGVEWNGLTHAGPLFQAPSTQGIRWPLWKMAHPGRT